MHSVSSLVHSLPYYDVIWQVSEFKTLVPTILDLGNPNMKVGECLDETAQSFTSNDILSRPNRSLY